MNGGTTTSRKTSERTRAQLGVDDQYRCNKRRRHSLPDYRCRDEEIAHHELQLLVPLLFVLLLTLKLPAMTYCAQHAPQGVRRLQHQLCMADGRRWYPGTNGKSSKRRTSFNNSSTRRCVSFLLYNSVSDKSAPHTTNVSRKKEQIIKAQEWLSSFKIQFIRRARV